ncbi:MAG: TonB-dependent receptor, partial [Bacteroidota bacterium]
GVLGGTYTHLIDKNSYFKASVALMGSEIEFFYDVLDSLNNRSNYHDERHNENRIATSLVYSRKINSSLRFKTGAFINFITNYDFYKRTIQRASISDIIEQNANLAINGQGSTQTLQYYAQLSKDINSQLTLNAGGHFMYLPLNVTSSLEPRLSLKYTPFPKHSFGLAYGLHSKILPFASYFYTVRDTINGGIQERLPNMDLPFVKSHHLIGSYTYSTPSGLRFSSEIYYQRLFNVPISSDPDNFYWMLNNSSEFLQSEVESGGKGENYGLDLALEQFFSNKVYFLLTASFYKSYFFPKNGQRYNSTFANDFVSSLTFGREFEFKKGRLLQVGVRVLYNGGNRYTPADKDASLEAGRYILDENALNSERIPNYFRIDARIAYRYNAPKLAGKISLDVQNVLNYQNPSRVAYDPVTNSLFFRNHTSGLVPVLAFEFDF